MVIRPRSLGALLAVVALIAVSCSGSGGQEQPAAAPSATATPAPPTVEEVAAEFVAAWQAQDWAALDGLTFDSASGAGAEHAEVWEELGVDTTSLTPGPLLVDGPRATQEIAVDLELDGLGPWSYRTDLGLVRVGGRWSVDWGPAVIHPQLVDGRRLDRRLVWPARAEILDDSGDPLRSDRPVVRIGVEPRRIEDRAALLTSLTEILDADPFAVSAALDDPAVQPDWFVPVAVVRADEYPELAPRLEGLAGVVVRDGFERLAPDDLYARHVLGTVGPITAEQLADWGEPYDATRQVGRSGLELVYEAELAGSPSGDIRLLDLEGNLVSVLATYPGREPVEVATTLAATMQAAAEAALDGVGQPAALVVIDAATGQVRAAVSRPLDGFSRALAGAYPPGSTFKTVTAAAFLDAGGTVASRVACPAEVFVTGLRFTNAGGMALGTISLETAYARSCNTAFVGLSTELPDRALEETAARFGFGLDYSVGLVTVGGSMPPPVDGAEAAASAIGQGRVTASPLHMASVAAAVASGTWRQPTLILEPARPAEVQPNDLGPEVTAALQRMMRSVVTSGTGGAVARAGSDISGKTGSAEFGTEDPPRTHAWFIGYRDGLAFSVLVEGGGAGGSVAAPIAAKFLRLLDEGAGA